MAYCAINWAHSVLSTLSPANVTRLIICWEIPFGHGGLIPLLHIVKWGKEDAIFQKLSVTSRVLGVKRLAEVGCEGARSPHHSSVTFSIHHSSVTFLLRLTIFGENVFFFPERGKNIFLTGK